MLVRSRARAQRASTPHSLCEHQQGARASPPLTHTHTHTHRRHAHTTSTMDEAEVRDRKRERDRGGSNTRRRLPLAHLFSSLPRACGRPLRGRASASSASPTDQRCLSSTSLSCPACRQERERERAPPARPAKKTARAFDRCPLSHALLSLSLTAPALPPPFTPHRSSARSTRWSASSARRPRRRRPRSRSRRRR